MKPQDIEMIRQFLQHKNKEKTSFDDYILSISKTLKELNAILKDNMPQKELINCISQEALKQGMILHFDKTKNIAQ